MALGTPRKPSDSGLCGERRRNGAVRIFAAGGNGVSGVCADEGGGSDVVKLDDALAAVDNFVAEKLGV